MRAPLLLAAFCVIGVPVVRAQNQLVTQQIGGLTYLSGSLNGQTVTGNVQQIGTTGYYNLNVGGQSLNLTTQAIGSQVYASDGSMSQRIGGSTYTTTPQGVGYTQQRIGNSIYTTGSNGCTSNTQVIGAQTYTNGSC